MTACETAEVVYRPTCPPLPAYTAESDARLADELEAAPVDAVWPDRMVDYYAVRDRCAALRDG